MENNKGTQLERKEKYTEKILSVIEEKGYLDLQNKSNEETARKFIENILFPRVLHSLEKGYNNTTERNDVVDIVAEIVWEDISKSSVKY